MSIFRLLPLLLLIAAGAASLTAQSSPEKILVASQPADSRQLNSPAAAEQNVLKPLNGIGTDGNNLKAAPPPRFLTDQDSWSSQDNVCLTMRTYKVARDNPHSDSTHAAGYTTCQPGARFRTHSIEYRLPAATP
jgi:hypothetical protein